MSTVTMRPFTAPIVIRDPLFEHFCLRGHATADARLLAFYQRLWNLEQGRRESAKAEADAVRGDWDDADCYGDDDALLDFEP